MSTRRALLTVGAGAMLAAGALPAPAAPNPFRDSTATTTVALDETGGWTADERLEIDLALAHEIGLSLAFPNAFRLPDEPSRILPGLLLPELTEASGTVDGATAPVTVESRGHRLALALPRRKAEPGVHVDELRHGRQRASRISGQELHTYVQVGGHEVTLRGSGLLEVLLEQRPGVFAPAGERTAGGWALTRSGPLAQTILVRRAAREIPAPTIGYA